MTDQYTRNLYWAPRKCDILWDRAGNLPTYVHLEMATEDPMIPGTGPRGVYNI